MLSQWPCLTALLALLVGNVVAVHPVEIRGQAFVDTITGKRLMIVGADYQPGGQSGYKPQDREDPLSNGTVCLRDAALLQRLGVNTIRVYNVDPTINHDECASIFNGVGIYMIIDVNSPLGGQSIDRSNPARSYHEGYLSRIFGVVENFKTYPNTLAFFAANEVMNDVGTARGDNPRYIRAVQRDLKAYIAKHSPRTIPVGYSAADVRPILEDTWAYMQCRLDGDDDTSHSDFFGLNSYSWCGEEATFDTAGYDDLVNMFRDSAVPVFFSEYGCNEPRGVPRPFKEVGALYGQQMTVLSGGLVYEYSQEDSDYGLVIINPNSTVTLRKDFDNLQSQYNALDLNLLQSAEVADNTPAFPACSNNVISNSGFSKNFTIPSLPEGGQELIDDGIKNPTNGKLIRVKATAVPVAVYGSGGNQINDLGIRLLSNDGTNLPGGENTSGDGPGPSATPTKKGSAAKSSITGGLLLAVALVMVALL